MPGEKTGFLDLYDMRSGRRIKISAEDTDLEWAMSRALRAFEKPPGAGPVKGWRFQASQDAIKRVGRDHYRGVPIELTD